MVQRHLPGPQFQHPGLALVHVHLDLLAAAEQVVGVEGVAMGDLVQLVGARDHAHGPVGGIAVGEGDPGGDDVGGIEAPVGGILVPGHEAGIARLLDEEAAAPAEDVRADHILYRIEDAGMANELIQPGEQQVGLVAQRALQAAGLGFEGFELAADRGRFGR